MIRKAFRKNHRSQEIDFQVSEVLDRRTPPVYNAQGSNIRVSFLDNDVLEEFRQRWIRRGSSDRSRDGAALPAGEGTVYELEQARLLMLFFIDLRE